MKRILLTMIAIVVLSTAPVASTSAMNTTSGDYSSMTIAQLVELINQLKARINVLSASESSACFVSDTTLSLGDGEIGDGLSDDVERLQVFLREKGFFTFSKNTGFFGKVTRTAVLSFQASVGLPQTGDFDAATRTKAHAMTCTKLGKIKTEVKNDIKKDEKKYENPVSKVSSIVAYASGSHITWSTVGNSPQGFKVVWSKNVGPTYPTREEDKYNFHPEPSTSSSNIDAFKGAGTYYVRVCEYLGGACGVYSNELTVQLQ